ncbi:DNA polymerase IV [Rhodococcus rhodnii]|uniref:DNA polymerase IV n=1 Tax=Rhodococcus rhodnii TaxID=38312 RepID=A0A6P2CIZ5_9NOCA|nr:DNA polymerase IV [Rhodococcus rhodnii]TXG92759.1 DNA polymerase IV [Rhodococcus rhodnii]
MLHLDMDAFFASAEQLSRPTLRGRPVLVGGLGGRGVVAGASYEARVFGARSAMPMHRARRLVGPAGVVLPPRGALYSALSGRVFEVVRSFVPVVEQLSVDEAFAEPADLAGASADEVRQWCERMRARVLEETGLVASLGGGPGKQAAKIASGLAKPNGVLVIGRDDQHAVLDPLPVRKLWGVGPVAEQKLARVGIDTIGEFARTPEVEVASLLGATIGPALHRIARGLDDRTVAERAEAKQISAETTFASDIVTLAQLRAAVDASAAQAFGRLRADGRAARTVVVKLKKSDMSVLTRSTTLAYASADPEVLAAAARRSILDPAEIGPIRLVGVGYSGLSTASQGSLFPDLDSLCRDGGSVALTTGGDPDTPAGPETIGEVPASARRPTDRWYPGLDVRHPEHGHGWVQGAGHGVLTVRFETRTTGPGVARTFSADDPDLILADALDSLA